MNEDDTDSDDQDIYVQMSAEEAQPEDATQVVAYQNTTQSAVVQNVAGRGNLVIYNEPGSTTNINIHVNQPRTQGTSSPPHQPYGTGPLLENVPSPPDKPAIQNSSVQPSEHSSKSLEFRNELEAADRCAEALRMAYKTTGSYIQMIPWVDDDSKDTEDIYTGLMLEIEEGLPGSERKFKILDSYGDIFALKTKHGDPIDVAILNGEPGTGKSTLVSKMAYDWALNVGVLRRYKLVFVLKMHALEQSSELLDAIFDQLLTWETGVDRRALDSFIQNRPREVLFLLDGFDEFMTSSLCATAFGSVLTMLNRKKYRGCSVVITTRPSHYADLVTKSLVQKPFIQVKVSGFSAENIDEYVHRFYPDKQEKADRLLERIKSSDILFDLAKSPMMLLLMSLLWRGDSELPETKSRLYSEALTYIFQRKATMSTKVIAEVVNEIGRVALRGLLSSSQILAFEESDFSTSELDSALKAGVLTKQRVLGGMVPHNSIEFVHKTLQEFCAAKHMQSLQDSDPQAFEKVMDQIVAEGPVKFGQLLPFCSGDNQACRDTILRSFQKVPFDGKLRMLAISCLFEGQSATLPPIESMRAVIPDELCCMVWASDCLNSLMYVLEQVADQAHDAGKTCIENMHRVKLLDCNMERFCARLAYSMNTMTELRSLQLIDCSLTDSNMTDIALSLTHAKYLTVLNLSYNETLGGSAVSWAPHLRHLKHLQTLVLSDCALTGEDVKHIALSERDVSSLVELDISHNETLAGSANVWCPDAKELKHLQTLRLVGCNTCCQDMKCIAEAVGAMGNLVNCMISFDKNQMLDNRFIKPTDSGIKVDLAHCVICSHKDLADVIAAVSNRRDFVELNLNAYSLPALDHRNLTFVQKLTIEYVSEKRESLKHFLFTVSCMENLVDCTVSFIYDTDILHLIQQTNESGIRIDLRKFSFNESDLAEVLEAMSRRCDLVELCLNGDALLYQAVLNFHLHELKHLRRLRLENCAVNTADLKPFLTSVAYLKNVVECSLGFIYVKEPIHFIEQCSTGVRVDLSKFRLKGKDLADVLESLSVRDNVFELSLCEKVDLSGTGYLWANKLRRLKHIQKLRFRNGSITQEDMKCIEQSLMCLPDLVELNVSAKGSQAFEWFNCEINIRTLVWGDWKYEKNNKGDLIAWFQGDATHHGEDVDPRMPRLDQGDSRTTGLGLLIVLNALLEGTSLVELILAGNHTVGGSTGLWAKHLMCLVSLERLDVSNCSLSGEDASNIIQSLRDLQNLVGLNLSGNGHLGESVDVWCPHFTDLQRLRSLNLCGCNFTKENILSLLLWCFGRLLDCCVTVASDDEITFLMEFTDPQCPTGVRLRLNQPITGTNLAFFLQAVSSPGCGLMELDLSGNPTLSGSAKMWSACLTELQHLQKLNLSDCSLTGEDIGHFEESLCGHGHLVELDLSFNPQLGSSLLSRRFPTVKEIKVEGCGFGVEEIDAVEKCVDQ